MKVRGNGMKPVNVTSNLPKREKTQAIALQPPEQPLRFIAFLIQFLVVFPRVFPALPIQEETANLIPITLAGS